MQNQLKCRLRPNTFAKLYVGNASEPDINQACELLCPPPDSIRATRQEISEALLLIQINVLASYIRNNLKRSLKFCSGCRTLLFNPWPSDAHDMCYRREKILVVLESPDFLATVPRTSLIVIGSPHSQARSSLAYTMLCFRGRPFPQNTDILGLLVGQNRAKLHPWVESVSYAHLGGH